MNYIEVIDHDLKKWNQASIELFPIPYNSILGSALAIYYDPDQFLSVAI